MIYDRWLSIPCCKQARLERDPGDNKLNGTAWAHAFADIDSIPSGKAEQARSPTCTNDLSKKGNQNQKGDEYRHLGEG